MRIKIIFFVFLFFIFISYANKVLVLNFEIFKNDSVKVYNMYVNEGYPTRYLFPGSYSIELLDEKGRVIEELKFEVDFTVYTDPPRDREKVKYDLAINYYKSAEKVRIRHKDKILFESNLKVLCNNNFICESNENALSCPSDCGPEDIDYYCTGKEDNICDPDCSNVLDKDCKPENLPKNDQNIFLKYLGYILIFTIIASILLIAVIILLFRSDKKPPSNKEEEKKEN